MARHIKVDGFNVSFEGREKRTVTVEGVTLPEETFLKIAELQVTGRDLNGNKSDGVDPNYQFVSLMRELELGEGYSTGTRRFKAPPYCTMFRGFSRPPVPR